MKNIYLDIMEKALSAYSTEQIDDYIHTVEKEGITEHGFPRLTANIGILLSKGRVTHLRERFPRMMELCTKQLPNKQTICLGNNFSIKELCFALMELEKSDVVARERIEAWKSRLRTLRPFESYNCIASGHDVPTSNWAAFSAASEAVRNSYLGVDEHEFIELELASQIVSINENGRYLDPYQPELYDYVTRLQLSVPLYFNRAGKHEAVLDTALKKAGEISLCLQSVAGEMAFGGRSNQFLFNEAVLAAVYEYEALRHARQGNAKKAGEFKAAARLAAKRLLSELEEVPGHVKNFHDPLSNIGCEGYGYFLKYMATIASYTYNAYFYSDDSIIPTVCPAERGCFVYETDDDFHKIIINNGGYFLQIEKNADFHYDANGLGCLHKSGVPAALCLSVPFAEAPVYKIPGNNAFNASICVYAEGGRYTGAEPGVRYKKIGERMTDDSLEAVIQCRLRNNLTVEQTYTVGKTGVDIKNKCPGGLGILLPAFAFDGREHTIIEEGEGSLTVSYRGHMCRYTFDGKLKRVEKPFYNRNGEYRLYKMSGKNVHIELT